MTWFRKHSLANWIELIPTTTSVEIAEKIISHTKDAR
jgi:hypothetical protein